MAEQRVAHFVADITLDGKQFRIGGNGRYILCKPRDPDPFGTVAYEEVELDDMDLDLIELLGASLEKNSRLEEALARKEE